MYVFDMLVKRLACSNGFIVMDNLISPILDFFLFKLFLKRRTFIAKTGEVKFISYVVGFHEDIDVFNILHFWSLLLLWQAVVMI